MRPGAWPFLGCAAYGCHGWQERHREWWMAASCHEKVASSAETKEDACTKSRTPYQLGLIALVTRTEAPERENGPVPRGRSS